MIAELRKLQQRAQEEHDSTKEKEVAAAETKSFDSAFDQDSDGGYQTSDSEAEKPWRQASRGKAASAWAASCTRDGSISSSGGRAEGRSQMGERESRGAELGTFSFRVQRHF